MNKVKIIIKKILKSISKNLIRFNKFYLSKYIKILFSSIIGILIANYMWDYYKDNSEYKKALEKPLDFRYEFMTDKFQGHEIVTKSLTGNDYETRIILVPNSNYFDHAGWFSNKEIETFPEAYSGILFYEFNPEKEEYELVYKFTPMAIDQEYIEEEENQKAPLLLTGAYLGNIDSDDKSELITEWSVCNFNHCIWSYPIVIGFDGGYYVKWTMPQHESSEQKNNSSDSFWSGEFKEREIVNTYNNRKYKINGGNYIRYKLLDNNTLPYIVSYNIEDDLCWACDHLYFLSLFSIDNRYRAKATYRDSKGLSEYFPEVNDFEFIQTFPLPN